MIMQWKQFNIHLPSLNKYLKDNVPSSNGIVASEESFEIMESSPFTQQDTDIINDYYNGLTEEGEQVKMNQPINPLPSYESNDMAIADGLLIGALYHRAGRVYVVYG